MPLAGPGAAADGEGGEEGAGDVYPGSDFGAFGDVTPADGDFGDGEVQASDLSEDVEVEGPATLLDLGSEATPGDGAEGFGATLGVFIGQAKEQANPEAGTDADELSRGRLARAALFNAGESVGDGDVVGVKSADELFSFGGADHVVGVNEREFVAVGDGEAFPDGTALPQRLGEFDDTYRWAALSDPLYDLTGVVATAVEDNDDLKGDAVDVGEVVEVLADRGGDAGAFVVGGHDDGQLDSGSRGGGRNC
jgi:hypothetical protein